MKERKLTGNEMFEVVKKECEKGIGVLFVGLRGTKWGRYKEEWKGVVSVNVDQDYGKYEGEIHNGLPNGQGTESYYVSPRKEKIYTKDPSTCKSAPCAISWKSWYVGSWKDGNYDGLGTFTRHYGYKHVGEYKNGFKDGLGISIYSNGSKFVGKWKYGEKHGLGISTNSDGSKFVWEWSDNKRLWGTEYDKDGNIIGKWAYGVKQK